jgi:hypothetical protein
MKHFDITTKDGRKHSVTADKIQSFGDEEVRFYDGDGEKFADFDKVENVSEQVIEIFQMYYYAEGGGIVSI